MLREEEGLEFAREAPLILALITPPLDVIGKGTVKVRDIRGHPCESRAMEPRRQRRPFDSLALLIPTTFHPHL
jgi:hypothetical protein